jgi:glycosyltransferase A (GT-A) superfamily protein (DUF2064 family)
MGQETPDGAQSVAIAIMCNTLEDGRGRTGLSPPLSPEEVIALSGCFIADMTATIDALSGELPVHGVAAVAPPDAEDRVRKILPEGFATLRRRGDTPAEWHAGVVEDLLSAGHDAVCLLTASSPTLPEPLLRQAVEAVSQAGERLVLAPAIGGRCALVGVRRFVPGLFSGLAWGTSRTLKQITDRASALSLPVETLNVWYEVADGLALHWLVRELLGDGAVPVGNGLSGASAPRTRAHLAFLAARGYGPMLDPDPAVKALRELT